MKSLARLLFYCFNYKLANLFQFINHILLHINYKISHLNLSFHNYRQSLMKQAEESRVQIKITSQQPVIFQMQSQDHIQPVQQDGNISQNIFTSDAVSRWHLGATIVLNFFYFLTVIILPISSADPFGKYFLISLVLISYIIYLTFSYSFSKLNFMFRLKDKQEYQEIYHKYTTAECRLIFTYAPTRNNIDEEIKKYQQDYQKIQIIDRSHNIESLQQKHMFAYIRYNKKYYFCTRQFKAQINNAFNAFIDNCKSNYDKFSRRILRSRQKMDFIIQDFVPEVGFSLNKENNLRIYYFITFGLGFSAYFEYYMRDKVLQKSIDIIKQISRK